MRGTLFAPLPSRLSLHRAGNHSRSLRGRRPATRRSARPVEIANMSNDTLLTVSLVVLAVIIGGILLALWRASRRDQEAYLRDMDFSIPMVTSATQNEPARIRWSEGGRAAVEADANGARAQEFGHFGRARHRTLADEPPIEAQAVPDTYGLSWEDEVTPAARVATPEPPAVEKERALPREKPAPALAEGTLQLLPGRLEVIEGGPGLAREIRLVRQSSADVPVITFGRQEGEQHRHVRLDAPTVSRRHARLSYDAGVWTLMNQSATNPTLVNGVPLATDASCALRDGDRVEMGEMVFRFRSR
jgi:hypothetical protein